MAAWSIPETYGQLRIVLFWLWLVNSEINWAGVIERDYLPIQPGHSRFYHIYRFINGIYYYFLLIWLAIMLIPRPLWLKSGFGGVFVIAIILRAIGDRKYRPKKPDE